LSLPKKSRAAVLVAYNQPHEIRELAIPELVPNAILVKVENTTVCGTDVHQWRGDYSSLTRPPIIQGHEIVARVVALGRGREQDTVGNRLAEGDRISWTYAFCNNCYFCRVAREPTLCVRRRMYGWLCCEDFPNLMGGYSEYAYVLPECDVVKVPDAIPSSLAAASSCSLRTAVHGFERIGGIGTQDTVVVQGAGPVGLWSTVMAAEAGAGQVITIGAPASRLELASQWGASRTIDIAAVPSASDRTEMIMGWTQGRGADVVIEAAGVPAAFPEAIDMVRRGGRVLIMGLAANDKPVTIGAGAIATKHLRVTGVVSGYFPHYYRALLFMASNLGKYPFERLISNTYSLERATEAVEAMAAMRELKPMIVPGM
jgi:L-iditol 2-dehydrogenase